MKKLLFAAVLLTQCLLVNTAWSARFEEGKHYVAIPFSEKLDTGKKVEVREFFWYGCGHCYAFEPKLEQWLKNKPASALFVRTPAFPRKAVHARSFYAFEAMGIVDKVHRKFFDELHQQNKRLDTEDAVAAFVKNNGFDADEFRKKFKSFAVDHKTKKAFSLARSYGVNSVPTIVVDGRYKVTTSTAGSHEKVIEVINYLVDKIAKSRK